MSSWIEEQLWVNESILYNIFDNIRTDLWTDQETYKWEMQFSNVRELKNIIKTLILLK